MYGLLDDTDNLVSGKPIAIYRRPGAITLPNGDQLPANWMQLFSLAEKEAIHIFPMTTTTFNSDQFYESGDATYIFAANVIAETLTTSPNAEPLSLNRYKDKAYVHVDSFADTLKGDAETTPSVSQDYTDDDVGKARADKRRNNKAKNNASINAADDHLFDHIDLIYDAADLIRDDVENAASYAAVDAVLDVMPVDARWPAWAPI